MTTLIRLNDVSLEFSNGHVVFENLNLTLKSHRTGLVGPNGVGKTSLARLLVGELAPSSGEIQLRALGGILAQREKPPTVTVEEYLGSRRFSAVSGRLLEPINRSQICSDVSGGEWMRVRLAAQLADTPQGGFLILDEPTNDLDRDGREALKEFLSDQSASVLLISHDRECLEFCDEIIELSNQGLSTYGGGWKFYSEVKALEKAKAGRKLDEAKRLREFAFEEGRIQRDRQVKRNRRGKEMAARGGMPKILIGARKRRAQATTGKIDSESAERTNDAVRTAFEEFSRMKIEPSMFAEISESKIPKQKLVAEARGFNIRYEDWLFPRDLDFSWRGPVRVALKGANGSGKTSLLRAILGEKLGVQRGELRTGNLRTLAIDQKGSSLKPTASVLENIQEVYLGDEKQLRTELARFLFTGNLVFQEVSTLSGGERLRAALAKGFLGTRRPELLVLDEPTNNLDLVNIEFLESLLKQFQGALIVVSHDERFLANSAITEELHVRP